MRATPKTSSPANPSVDPWLFNGAGRLTFAYLGTKGDVLLSRALNLLLGGHDVWCLWKLTERDEEGKYLWSRLAISKSSRALDVGGP